MVYRSQLRLCGHALWRKRVFWVERLQAGGKLIEGTAKRPGNPVGEQRARDDQKDKHASQFDGEIHGFVGDVVVRHGNRDLQRIDAGGRCNGEHLSVVGRGAVFGARDEKAGAVVSREEMFSLGFNHTPAVTEGVLAEECAKKLSDFFADLREKRKKCKK